MSLSKKYRPRASMTWSDVADLMDKIAVWTKRDVETQLKLAALHKSLARDLRALVKGQLVNV